MQVSEIGHFSLLSSILCSRELRRLFYTMLHASRQWKQNKWWLFDRVVESPHRTAFFVRNDPSNERDMEEAAQHWYVTGRHCA